MMYFEALTLEIKLNVEIIRDRSVGLFLSTCFCANAKRKLIYTYWTSTNSSKIKQIGVYLLFLINNYRIV